MNEIILNNEQKEFIKNIKEKVRESQYKALRSVNKELINLYWDVGKSLSERQNETWGKSIIKTLSNELQKEFPGIKGFSVSNIQYMLRFYNEYHSMKISNH